MTVDPPIHQEGNSNDRLIVPAASQHLHVKWKFEGPRHFHHINVLRREAKALNFSQEAISGRTNNFSMPTCTNDCDAGRHVG